MNPQVNTKKILPHPVLRPHLRYFAVRNFDTGNIIFPKAIIADSEIQLNIFLSGRENGFNKYNDGIDYDYNPNNNTLCYLTGMQSSTKGFVLMCGATSILTLHFTPTGFYHLFKIAPESITDKIGLAENICGTEIRLLYEQMLDVADLLKSIQILETYLIGKLHSSTNHYLNHSILYAANSLIASKGNHSIGTLAKECNMSIQTLEIRFRQMVGTDPKTFGSTVRFNNAVLKKLYNPKASWTSIAHEFGYYDQMHMIKSFKIFSGMSPKEFMRIIQPPIEDFIE